MYTTLEAHLDNGRITVAEPQMLPSHAVVLLTVLHQESEDADRGTELRLLIQKTAGIIPPVDGAKWQRDVRSEWGTW